MKNSKIIMFLLGLLLVSCQEKTKQEKIDETTDSEKIVEVQKEPIVKVISPEDFKNKVDKKTVQLIDVRRPKEFAEGHLKNSKNINVLGADFVKNMENAFDKNKPIYVYCKGGTRSARASTALKEAGFTEIYDLKGGFLAWSKKNLEIEK
ncbi:rhodanese-like domain-containing protein [Aureibaculum conchae]|uniref:rhodanese-like domain-containing protein n=1 Tax=Aureibaculum sp. 2308TA14-22 TaxID=3108392 RepID=UPI0033979A6B